jgi:hypothetical protein
MSYHEPPATAHAQSGTMSLDMDASALVPGGNPAGTAVNALAVSVGGPPSPGIESARLAAYSELTGLTAPLKSLARTTAQACGVHRCSIFVSSDGLLVPLMSQLASGERQEHLWRTFMSLGPYRIAEIPAFVRAIEERRPVVLPDAREECAIPGQWKTFGAASGALMPLVGEAGVVGMMVLDSRAPEITRAQVRRARDPARCVASVIDGALSVIEMRDQLRDAETIVSLGRTIGPTQDVVRRITDLYARAARAAMDAERARVDDLLHDTVHQTLFSVGLRIERALRRRHGTTVLRTYLREIKHDIGLIMTQINQVISFGPMMATVSEPSCPQRAGLTDGSAPDTSQPHGHRPEALSAAPEDAGG